MQKRVFLVIFLVLILLNGCAKDITKEEAQEKSLDYLFKLSGGLKSKDSFIINNVSNLNNKEWFVTLATNNTNSYTIVSLDKKGEIIATQTFLKVSLKSRLNQYSLY